MPRRQQTHAPPHSHRAPHSDTPPHKHGGATHGPPRRADSRVGTPDRGAGTDGQEPRTNVVHTRCTAASGHPTTSRGRHNGPSRQRNRTLQPRAVRARRKAKHIPVVPGSMIDVLTGTPVRLTGHCACTSRSRPAPISLRTSPPPRVPKAIPPLGFGLWALGFGLWALGFGLWALGFGLWALGCPSRSKEGLTGPRVASTGKPGSGAPHTPPATRLAVGAHASSCGRAFAVAQCSAVPLPRQKYQRTTAHACPPQQSTGRDGGRGTTVNDCHDPCTGPAAGVDVVGGGAPPPQPPPPLPPR